MTLSIRRFLRRVFYALGRIYSIENLPKVGFDDYVRWNSESSVAMSKKMETVREREEANALSWYDSFALV